MKYTEAWSSVVSQNLSLKFFSIILGVICIILGMMNLKLSFKDALIVERGCASKVVAPLKDEHSKSEIDNFLREALSQRFDSQVYPSDGLLSPDEMRFREVEQKEFLARNMNQKIVLNSVSEGKDGFQVDADRIISVSDVRSAFKFSLTVKLESKKRSLSNPYGLLLVSSKLNDEKSSAKKTTN